MPTAELERVVETTGGQDAQVGIDIVEALIELLPWSRNLAAADFLAMAHELRGAAIRWRSSQDLTEFTELVADWEASAQASQNRGLMDQLADAGKDTYVPWR